MSGEALGVDAILRRADILHEYKVNVAVHHSSSGFRDWRYYSITPVTVPEENRDTAELSHVQMAVQAYCGSPLSEDRNKKNLYDFLELRFETANAPSLDTVHLGS